MKLEIPLSVDRLVMVHFLGGPPTAQEWRDFRQHLDIIAKAVFGSRRREKPDNEVVDESEDAEEEPRKRPGPSVRYNEEQVAKLKSIFDQAQMSIREAASQVGIGEQTARKILIRAGLYDPMKNTRGRGRKWNVPQTKWATRQ